MTKLKIMCKCGKGISPNTLGKHVKSKKCSLAGHDKDKLLSLLRIVKEHRYAWLLSEGQDAVHNEKWWHSVIYGQTKLEDWTFISPRKLGEVTPKQRKKMSIDRKGRSNPASRNKPLYDREEILDFIRREWFAWQKDIEKYHGIKEFYKIIEEEFPKWLFTFSDYTIGLCNKRKALISLATRFDEKDISAFLRKRRGLHTSVGQKASPKCMAMASKMGAKNLSNWKVTKPQKKLFAIVKKWDPAASLEFKVQYEGRFKSYDIYSPKIQSVIEMHGRVWHDPLKTTVS